MFNGVKIPEELIIRSSALSTAVLLPGGYAVGHVVCYPKRQCSKQLELNVDELVDLWQLATEIGAALSKALPETTGISYIVNDAVDAGQKVGHIYLNVIPRKQGDFQGMFDIYDKSEVTAIWPLALDRPESSEMPQHNLSPKTGIIPGLEKPADIDVLSKLKCHFSLA